MTTNNQDDPFALGGDHQDDNAALEEFAAIEFEPLSEKDRLGWYGSLGQPQWGESTQNFGVTLRLALAVVEKTKDELVAIARSLSKQKDPENKDEDRDLLCMLVDNFEDVEGALNELAQLARSARMRQVSAAAVVMLEKRS